MILTTEQIAVVLAAQQALLDNPRRAVVNSESSFVRTIIAETEYDVAMAYWRWVCSQCSSHNTIFVDAKIIANQKMLEAIDASVTMPHWGYSGT